MDELLETLEDIKPNVGFETYADLIDDGYLGSFDIPSIVSELNDVSGVEILFADIVSGSFSSADALWKVV